MKLQATTLSRLYGCTPAVALSWAPHVDAALVLAECDEKPEVAYFLAQVGHESGGLRYTRELWGPTKQQLRYEPGTTLATRLGNVEPGDGARYMGRGLIQTTGRANYAMTTVLMRELFKDAPDFERNPELLQARRWAALSAGLFWREKKLNKWMGDFAEQTRRINGGYNGLAHRQALLARALVIL